MKYVSPTSVEEAVGLLGSGGARVFAGATDLIPQLRAGRPEPDSLVDLKRIDRLVSLTRDDSGWTIGAATPAVHLTEDADLAAAFPGLVEAAGLIGSDQIQSRCSLGGNLCNASPAADSVPAMVVNRMRAVIATASVAGPTRTIPVEDVVTGPGQTSLGPGEFVVEFELDLPPARSCDAYLRFIPRTEMDIAVVGVGARVTLDEAGAMRERRHRPRCRRPDGGPGGRRRGRRRRDGHSTRTPSGRSPRRPVPPATRSTTSGARSPTGATWRACWPAGPCCSPPSAPPKPPNATEEPDEPDPRHLHRQR